MLLIIYVISVILNYIIYKKILRAENRKNFNPDEKGIIFTPVINTISLVIELWDATLGK